MRLAVDQYFVRCRHDPAEEAAGVGSHDQRPYAGTDPN
ncbi:hypothetical protein NK6_822 [Bradyrhizobium diazoefficiens]|uniref:Uncharacterized protein n=1 Tax=Bradyrhizobium diazoefficiens TaxID=1355477 RepID=A0A0E4BKS6_9BRAD|nr:hypothetical protein NK6_822 [Bradyrhizobium diazoefficiens]